MSSTTAHRKAKPTAAPSGKLCKVMAKTNSQIRRARSRDPAGPMASMSTGANRFRTPMAAAPSRTAAAMTPAAMARLAP